MASQWNAVDVNTTANGELINYIRCDHANLPGIDLSLSVDRDGYVVLMYYRTRASSTIVKYISSRWLAQDGPQYKIVLLNYIGDDYAAALVWSPVVSLNGHEYLSEVDKREEMNSRSFEKRVKYSDTHDVYISQTKGSWISNELFITNIGQDSTISIASNLSTRKRLSTLCLQELIRVVSPELPTLGTVICQRRTILGLCNDSYYDFRMNEL